VVEDTRDHADLIGVLLSRREAGSWESEFVETLTAAMARLTSAAFDVVLLDLMLPDSLGLQTISAVCRSRPELPIVVATVLSDEALGVAAVQEGAQDYLIKGHFDALQLGRSLRLAIERKRGEVAIARLAAIVETSHEAIMSANLDGTILHWNAGAERLYGYTREEAVGRSIEFLVPQDRRHELQEIESLVRRGEIVEPYETVRLRKDGAPIDVSLTISPIRERTGAVNGASIIVRDITARVQAERALQSREARFRAMVERSAEAAVAIDPEGTVLYVAPSISNVVGFGDTEMLGESVWDFVHSEDAGALRERIETILEAPGTTAVSVHRMRHRSGGFRHIEATITNLLDVPEVKALVCNCRDITERAQLEEQLRQAQKMEAIGRLAGGVAHDFNNILGVITGLGELARRGVPAGERVAARIDGILAAARRAADLTQQLLAFSRQQILQPQVLNLNAVLRDMEDMLHRLIGEDVQLVMRLDRELGQVRVDPGQITQIVVNLAVNARDAMPEGGTLTLETANVDHEDNQSIDNPAAQPAAYVRLTVIDTGVGMDPETRARIFEPFFTTKANGQGTGLGLAVTYGIVRQSGGDIEVDSQRGRGTTFSVYLPRVDAPARVPEATGSPAEGGRETILLVEDEPSLREILGEVLQEAGYKVLTAADAREATTRFEESSGQVSLLVTDMVMPLMSGKRLGDQLSAHAPGLRILYISGYTDSGLVQEGMVSSGAAFLQKPFAPDELLRRVRQLLDEKP
jgi:PAS domain S-box-containing protein